MCTLQQQPWSVAAQPTQLTADSQADLVSVVDAILDAPHSKGGQSFKYGSSLLSGVGSVAAARAPATVPEAEAAAARSRCSSSNHKDLALPMPQIGGRALASSRRSLMENKIIVETRSIALAAACQMAMESPPLVVSGRGITTTIYKEHKSALALNQFGTSGTVCKMPSGIAPWTSMQDAVVVETTDLPYTPQQKLQQTIYSSVVSFSVSLSDGATLSPEDFITNALQMVFTLRKSTPSPVCLYWCKSDGSCKCSLGWTGEACSTQYCDQSLLKCQNQGRCICAANIPVTSARVSQRTSAHGPYRTTYQLIDKPVAIAHLGTREFCVSLNSPILMIMICKEDNFKKKEGKQEATCLKAASSMRAPVQWMLLFSLVLPASSANLIVL